VKVFEVEILVSFGGWFDSAKVNGELISDNTFQGVRTKGTFMYNGKKYMIKFGDQSAAEWHFLENMVEEQDKKFFMPSIQGGYITFQNNRGKEERIGYIIQEFVEFDTYTSKIRLNSWAEIEGIIEKYNLSDLRAGSDGEGRNWSLVNGKPIIYDWGLGNCYEGIGLLS
jgi:hypothetical protein